MISHRNVIANIMQIAAFDSIARGKLKAPGSKYAHQENALGLLPMSHIYGLVVICHASVYQGDGVIVLPKFEFKTCLAAIQNYKISVLYLVSQQPAMKLYSSPWTEAHDSNLHCAGSAYYHSNDEEQAPFGPV